MLCSLSCPITRRRCLAADCMCLGQILLPRQSLYLNLDLGYLSMKHSILEALKSGRDTKRPLHLAQENLCDGDKLGKLPTRKLAMAYTHLPPSLHRTDLITTCIYYVSQNLSTPAKLYGSDSETKTKLLRAKVCSQKRLHSAQQAGGSRV